MSSGNYHSVLFYQYVDIEDTEALLARERAVCEVLGLTGRMIIAEEGVNATLEGSAEAISRYIAQLKKDKRFIKTDYKVTPGSGRLFPRLSIKIRDEIVASHLPKEIDPTVDTGVHLAPEVLRSWFEGGKDFEIIDMRNDYEYAVGHFRNSHESGMKNFRDLEAVTPQFEHLKDKPVLTVCTGGVRCEKASAYLKAQGFKEVYQLHGGIHRYMEKYPGQDFKGALYTFDGRVTMHFGGEREIVGRCTYCNAPSEAYADCLDDLCGAHFIACDACRDAEGRAGCPQHRTTASVI
ncbi:MAG: hypothetical protein RLZZ234_231 [Candidatus Parcubacteria bacterium]